jgi:hypothetical protein
MEVLKVKLFKPISFLISIVVLATCFLTPMASAVSTTSWTAQSGYNGLFWLVGEDTGDGFVVLVPVSASCNVNYFETGYTSGSLITLTKHEIFACAQNWNGNNPEIGANLYVTTGYVTYTNTSGGQIASFCPSIVNNNVLTGSNWIWGDRYSTSTYNTGVARVNCQAYGNFYCGDAISNWYQTITASMLI